MSTPFQIVSERAGRAGAGRGDGVGPDLVQELFIAVGEVEYGGPGGVDGESVNEVPGCRVKKEKTPALKTRGRGTLHSPVVSVGWWRAHS